MAKKEKTQIEVDLRKITTFEDSVEYINIKLAGE